MHRSLSILRKFAGRTFSSNGNKFSIPNPQMVRIPLEEMPRVMHPDWYRTPRADDDPRMIGDYPDVPAESYQLRSPYNTYFDQQGRRNFGEAMPEDYEPLTMWSFDHETSYGRWFILGGMGALFGSIFVLYRWLGNKPSLLTDFTIPKELPTVAKYFENGKIPHRMTHEAPVAGVHSH